MPGFENVRVGTKLIRTFGSTRPRSFPVKVIGNDGTHVYVEVDFGKGVKPKMLYEAETGKRVDITTINDRIEHPSG